MIAWTGAITALFAATIAITQTDIKKILAYSTVSQLGYMFLAAGCGGYAAALFHLATHAFFKALLFLGAGAVILAMHHEQDTDKMGGLARAIPRTRWVFLVGVIAISGLPPFAGFFSKDEILLTAFAAHSVPGNTWLYGIGVVTAVLTSLYMFRLYFRTFHGATRLAPENFRRVHEPSETVRYPLYVLAAFSLLAGFAGFPQVYGDWLGIPDSNSLAHFLAPVLAGGLHDPGVSHGEELRLALLALGAAAAGLVVAWWFYLRSPDLPGRIMQSFHAFWLLLHEKYFVDEVYDALFVRPTVWISDRVLFRFIDAGLIDGMAVNGTARGVQALAARGLKYVHSGPYTKLPLPHDPRHGGDRGLALALGHTMTVSHLVSLVTFLPLAGGLAVLLLDEVLGLLSLSRLSEGVWRWMTLALTTLTFVLSLGLWTGFDATRIGFQFVERVPWLPDYGVSYFVGIDGVSLLLLVMTTFLMPLVILSAWNDIRRGVRTYLFFMLALETGMLGAFVALNLFQFYLFWEVMLIPMYFIIGIWGGHAGSTPRSNSFSIRCPARS